MLDDIALHLGVFFFNWSTLGTHRFLHWYRKYCTHKYGEIQFTAYIHDFCWISKKTSMFIYSTIPPNFSTLLGKLFTICFIHFVRRLLSKNISTVWCISDAPQSILNTISWIKAFTPRYFFPKLLHTAINTSLSGC